MEKKTSDLNHYFIGHDQSEQLNEDNDVKGTQEVNDILGDTQTHLRLQRTRKVPIIHLDSELLSDIASSDEGELIHFSLLVDVKLINYKDAMKSDVQRNVVIDELKLIENNHTQELVDSLERNKTIDVMQIFKVKMNSYGIISKNKERLLARGLLHRYCIGYNELFPMRQDLWQQGWLRH